MAGRSSLQMKPNDAPERKSREQATAPKPRRTIMVRLSEWTSARAGRGPDYSRQGFDDAAEAAITELAKYDFVDTHRMSNYMAWMLTRDLRCSDCWAEFIARDRETGRPLFVYGIKDIHSDFQTVKVAIPPIR